MSCASILRNMVEVRVQQQKVKIKQLSVTKIRLTFVVYIIKLEAQVVRNPICYICITYRHKLVGWPCIVQPIVHMNPVCPGVFVDILNIWAHRAILKKLYMSSACLIHLHGIEWPSTVLFNLVEVAIRFQEEAMLFRNRFKISGNNSCELWILLLESGCKQLDEKVMCIVRGRPGVRI